MVAKSLYPIKGLLNKQAKNIISFYYIMKPTNVWWVYHYFHNAQTITSQKLRQRVSVYIIQTQNIIQKKTSSLLFFIMLSDLRWHKWSLTYVPIRTGQQSFKSKKISTRTHTFHTHTHTIQIENWHNFVKLKCKLWDQQVENDC